MGVKCAHPISGARALSALRDPLEARGPLGALVLSEAKDLSAAKAPWAARDPLGALVPSGARDLPDRRASSLSCLPARRRG